MGPVIRRHLARTVAAALVSMGLVAASAVPAAADTVRDKQWFFASLQVDAAQKITRGAGVVVAVVDSGVWAEHPDLRDAVLPGLDTFPTFAKDGRDDQIGHGTAMAGLIAGRGHNGSDGVIGVAPEAKILPIKIALEQFASASGDTKAIDWATKNSAKVINMSFGTGEAASTHEAIKRAQAADIVLIAGAGNLPRTRDYQFPGAYPEVLTVGSVDRDGKVTDFSVKGPQVDLVAPGVDITYPYLSSSGNYQTGYGTSQSTAIVAGAAALVRAKFPNLSAVEVVHRLEATAIDKGPEGRDDEYGYGVLNLMGALTADVPPLEATASPAPADDPGGPVAATPAPPTGRSLGPLLWVGGAVAVLLGIALVIALVVLSRRSQARRSY